VRDIGYRTPDGGWLVKSNLNSPPCDVSDLPRTMTTTVGGRGGGGRTISTANSDNCKYDNDCNNEDDNNRNSLLLLFMLERDLLLETLATMDVGIICLCTSS
jgi:hypothetical protein